MSLFTIDGKTYEMRPLVELSLRDTLTLPVELAALGIHKSWQRLLSDGQRIGTQVQGSDAALDDPDGALVFAVMVWAARRKAGEDVTFADIIEVSWDRYDFPEAPGDRMPPKAPTTPKKAKPKNSTQKGYKPPAV